MSGCIMIASRRFFPKKSRRDKITAKAVPIKKLAVVAVIATFKESQTGYQEISSIDQYTVHLFSIYANVFNF